MIIKKLFPDNNIQNALFAVASSILTSILCDEFTDGNYVIQQTAEQIKIIQIREHNFVMQIFFIIGIYLIIWCLITLLVPRIFHFLSRFRYPKIKNYSKKMVVSHYKETKHSILKLHGVICNEGKENDISYITLYTEELSCIINKMYATFCSPKEYNRKVIKSSFRKGVSINDIGLFISPYEYYALIEEIKKLLDICLSNNTDPISQLDYEKLQARINKLENIIVEI